MCVGKSVEAQILARVCGGVRLEMKHMLVLLPGNVKTHSEVGSIMLVGTERDAGWFYFHQFTTYEISVNQMKGALPGTRKTKVISKVKIHVLTKPMIQE